LKAAEALVEPLAAADKTSTHLQAAVARIWASLGAAYGGPPGPGPVSRSREACSAFERSARAFAEHESRAPLAAADRAEATAVARARDACASRGLLKAPGRDVLGGPGAS
jgi:hypothetical protein